MSVDSIHFLFWNVILHRDKIRIRTGHILNIGPSDSPRLPSSSQAQSKSFKSLRPGRSFESLSSNPTMSRLEELPDDFDESLNLNPSPAPVHAPPSAPNASTTASSTPFPIDASRLEENGTTPALPPHMASVRSHTADEIVQLMNRTPLFMTSLQDTDGEGMWQAADFIQGARSYLRTG